MRPAQLADLVDQLRKSATTRTRADGSAYASIAMAAAGALAGRLQRCLGDVETAALGQGIVPERYSRNQAVLSTAEQLVLSRAAVAVVGLGGLGGSVTEMLARTGIGRLTLIDADRFEESNLNRQLLCTCKDLGRWKAEVAAERVGAINPAVTASPQIARVETGNARRLLAGHQLVVDCLDNLPDRFVVEKACRDHAVPLVSAAVAGFCGQLTVVFPADRGLAAVYGEPAGATATGAEASLGNLAVTVGAMAALQCAEVINVLRTGASALRNRLLVMDLADATVEVVDL